MRREVPEEAFRKWPTCGTKGTGIPFCDETGRPTAIEAAMKQLLYAAGLICALMIPTTYLDARESKQPAAVVTDMPEAVDLSYASPESWFALPSIIDGGLKPPSPALLPTELNIPLPSIQLAAVP